MTLDEHKKRVVDLTAACEQTAGHHNMMCGRLAEAKECLAYAEAQILEAAKAEFDKKCEAEGPATAPTDAAPVEAPVEAPVPEEAAA